MTKSKLVNAKGQVAWANLHPTKKEVWNGHTYRGRVAMWAKKGFTEAKWSK